ncbi:MAG: PAS domain-containing protein [Vicinamibacterales bacterium]
MAAQRVSLTGKERTFGEHELIVSKTDLTGKITYANDVFVRVSGYSEAELIGAPHSILRHPDMPRCVFKLLWDTIAARQEVFAYVINTCKNGDHYWVFAHVTPSYDIHGAHVGYHSNRRVPHADAIAKVKPLYATLLSVEAAVSDRKASVDAGTAAVVATLKDLKLTYSQFVFGLSASTRLDAEAA